MANIEQTEKNERTSVLESQLSNRNTEVSMLRREIEEKNRLCEEMLQVHMSDTKRQTEMTQLIESASAAIENLQQNISTQELNQQESLTLIAQSKKKTASYKKSFFISWSMALPLFSYLYFSSPSPGHSNFNTENTIISKNTTSLSAKKLELAEQKSEQGFEPQQEAVTPKSEATTFSTPLASDTIETQKTWPDLMGAIREKFFRIAKETAWEDTPAYGDISTSVVITRTQFRDLVSHTLPFAQSPKITDGVILFAVNSKEIDEAELEKKLTQNEIPNTFLCDPKFTDIENLKRISIFISSDENSMECLQKFINHPLGAKSLNEITVIALMDDAKFSQSYYTEKQFVNLQQWNLNWITKVIIGTEPEDTSLSQIRAQRLAFAARALIRSSDVRIQVPVKQTIDYNDLTKTSETNKYISFGNFSVIPATLPQGPIKATRISLSQGKAIGKTITQNLAPKARAVIINGEIVD